MLAKCSISLPQQYLGLGTKADIDTVQYLEVVLARPIPLCRLQNEILVNVNMFFVKLVTFINGEELTIVFLKSQESMLFLCDRYFINKT